MASRSAIPAGLSLAFASTFALLCGLTSAAHAYTPYPGYPVISRVQFLFSVVTHYHVDPQRKAFYDANGSPQGSSYYALPYLVYEPTVTLYNPYNAPISLFHPQVKIWDPPVGFIFKKNANVLRSEFTEGEFLGLARFQPANEANPAARKTFTLALSDLLANQQPSGRVELLPGESKTFACWVEKDWTWGKETAGDVYNPRCFFDWRTDRDFTNRDHRTGNLRGFEAVSTAWPFYGHAGFQTDCLSVSTGRPANTLYTFETGSLFTNAPWVTLKLTDTFTLQAKSMRTNPGTGADFQIDYIRDSGAIPGELVKEFPMSIAGIIQNDAQPVITRTFRPTTILQTNTDKTFGGKTSFAAVTMIAKASALRANRFYTSPPVPTSELYEMHFTEAVDPTLITVLASDVPTGGPQILGHTRVGKYLYIDFSGRANPTGANTWKVRGTSNLQDGFPDNLDSLTTIQAGQSASGIYKAAIDISALGDRYFVRIEE